jgi:protein gp37
MSDTKIEWATKVWNPLRGCSKVSEGCKNCYAIKQAHRFSGEGMPFEGLTRKTDAGVNWTGRVMLVPDMLEDPLKWKQPQRIFVNSMSDLFHQQVPQDFIDKVFEVMKQASHHTFMILTKRPERMSHYMQGRPKRGLGSEVLPNVWLGTSVEDQKAADERIPLLLQTPAAVRFLSCEPLLGSVELFSEHHNYLEGWENDMVFDPGCQQPMLQRQETRNIDWVIVGGESGHGARPMHPEWARSLRDQCQAAGVSFFFKQFGEWIHNSHSDFKNYDGMSVRDEFSKLPNGLTHVDCYRKVGKGKAGRLLDGVEWNEFPNEKEINQ